MKITVIIMIIIVAVVVVVVVVSAVPSGDEYSLRWLLLESYQQPCADEWQHCWSVVASYSASSDQQWFIPAEFIRITWLHLHNCLISFGRPRDWFSKCTTSAHALIDACQESSHMMLGRDRVCFCLQDVDMLLIMRLFPSCVDYDRATTRINKYMMTKSQKY